MRTAVIYARVSSREQADEGYSIDAQLKLLHQYAAENELRVDREFVDVETAKRAGRTGFGEMVEHLRRRRKSCRVVLVEKTDRLHRNLRDYVTLDELDLEIHFVKENFILSDECRSTEKFMHGIKVLMAKNYVDNLSEETRKGMCEKAAQGTYPSYAPVGYTNVQQGSQRAIVPDPEKAMLVRRMFELYAAGGISLEQLRLQISADGLTGRNGGVPSKAWLAKALQNVFYTGLFIWKGKTYQGDHEPLVSADLFERTQLALRKGNKPKERPSAFFAYRGLLKCSHCGCAITAERKKGKYVYYHCTGFHGNCPTPHIREEDLENLFGELVAAITIDAKTAEWIKQALQDSHQTESHYHSEQTEDLQAQYLRVQRKLDQAYEDKLDGKIAEDFWKRKSEEWREEQVRVRAAIERHENANRFYFQEGCRILDLANRAYDLWLAQGPEERAKLLKLLLSNCTFDGTKLTATYAKPFCWLATEGSRLLWLPDVDSNHEHTG